jgi:C-terminal processing protease CtpA/Prc
MILIGLLGEDRSGQLKIQNLFEIFPHLWLQSTLSENEGPFSPSVYSSYKVGHDYSNVIQKKAFSLGKDFSATAEQIKTHPEYLHKLYPNHFYKAFESSHFYLQLQPSLIRLFDLEAKKTEYESDDGFLDSSTATHLNSHISFQLNKNGEKVAVLTIKSFLNENPNPMGEFGYQPQLIETLLQQVSNEKASLLILDLRENNGGLLAHSKHLLTELTGGATDGFIITNEIYAEAARRTNSIPKNPIDFKTEEHSSELTQVLNQLFPIKFKNQPLSVRKIQILVSKATASAGESTALALREFSGAVIIGQKTTGHVLGSVTKKLAFGFEGHYPIADYISRNGVRIEGVGIQPDIELDPKTDALKFALEL